MEVLIMPNGWQEVYTELTDFIAEHSEVEIEASHVHLPESFRPEFYRLFNAVRTALVEEKFPALLSEARVLSENYLKAEQEVTELLGLDDVSMVASLGRFLHDSMDELKRGLFDPLFDLLKAKVDIESFEQKTTRSIGASFGSLYRSGYEKWVALSLVKLLEADKTFQVNLRELTPEDEVIMSSLASEEQVPPPEESKRLSFRHELVPLFTVPDFIVHSAKLNRYVGVRSEFGAAIAKASNASQQRKWYPLDSVISLEPGLTLIYVAEKSEEISLIADVKKICRPDLILECREQKDWFEKEEMEKVKLHHDLLKPRLGTYIVSREPKPEQVLAELEDGIHILTAGFDANKLTPIIDAFISHNA
jgi:hypothetical protein